MCVEIRKLRIDDGRDIYEMLQELPADENGFINPVKGKTFDEYKEWLKKAAKSSEQTGVVDGWKVPETTFWFFENNCPVGYGKVRHFLTEALKENGGNIGYAIVPSARNRGLGKKLLLSLINESKKIRVLTPRARSDGANLFAPSSLCLRGNKLLLTIRNHNKPSIHVALANGGKIEMITETHHYIWIGS